MGLPSHCMLRIRPRRGILLVSTPQVLLLQDFKASLSHTTSNSSPIPEITDADMAFQAEETHANSDIKPFHKQYRLFHAAFAQWCYTGAQVAIASYFINYVDETRSNTDSSLAAKFLAGAQGAFALGRFVGVGIMKYVRPRWVLLTYLLMCIVFIAPSITQRENTGMSMLYLTLFFESICFPTILALGMRGLGKYTKRGSGFIVAGVSGGAAVSVQDPLDMPILQQMLKTQLLISQQVPPLLGAVADLHNSTALAMTVPLAFFVAAWTYAFCINFVPAYRDVADKFAVAEVGMAANLERSQAGILADSPNLRGDEEKGVVVEREENSGAAPEVKY